jgi:Family of unknown function (DUF6069)
MSSKTSTPAASRTQRPTQRTRLLAVAGAAAAALAVWAVAVPLTGIDLTVRIGGGSDTQQIGSGEVVLVSLLAGLAGWALLDLLERFTSHTRGIWTASALVVLAVSLLGPLGGGVTTAARVALTGMHLAAAAVLIPLLARSARPRRS